jgi:hypothetical protein
MKEGQGTELGGAYTLVDSGELGVDRFSQDRSTLPRSRSQRRGKFQGKRMPLADENEPVESR